MRCALRAGTWKGKREGRPRSDRGEGSGFFAGDFAEDVFEGDQADDFAAVVGDEEEGLAGDAHAGEEVVGGEVLGD